MPRLKLLFIFAAVSLTNGCGSSFQTDGTREAGIVRQWLSPGWAARRGTDALIEPGAPLVMSDFQVPLTLWNLRTKGPDRLPGCERSTIRRQDHAVVASWTCSPGTDLAFRTVYFQVRNGRIASANYTEAYEAVKVD